MSGSPFAPSFEELPASLPIFPLTGVLLLPRGRLPLNIFEPRYLEMTRDALATDRIIGMIQPKCEVARAARPSVYEIGCAGRITAFSETDDGRYLITLTGLCRFAVEEEMAAATGYRRVVADWARFRGDFGEEPDGRIDRPRLEAAVRRYFDTQGIRADWRTVEKTADDRLVTSLAMICPFPATEKQALLECPDLASRAALMCSLLEMALFENGGATPGGAAPHH